MKNNRKVEYIIKATNPNSPDDIIDEIHEAIFHRWGTCGEQLKLPMENGEAKWTFIARTTAIIEDLKTGEVHELLPEAIRFTE